MRAAGLVLTLALVASGCARAPAERVVIVGSKAFTEGVILGEVVQRLLASSGIAAVHRRQLGGTRILWDALLGGEVDVYVEYTGTLSEEILGGAVATDVQALATALVAEGVRLGPALGFENNYAIGMLDSEAARRSIATLSELAAQPGLRLGFSNEFMDRGDGWPGLQRHYGMRHDDVRGLDHDLAYRALAAAQVDAIDLYSTDAEIDYYGLAVLTDDRGYFPEYAAVVVYRAGLQLERPDVVAALEPLAGLVSAAEMSRMNAAVKLGGAAEGTVAAEHLRARLGLESTAAPDSWMRTLWTRTLEHLTLVAISMAAAIVVALPLGVLAARYARLGRVVLGFVAIVQTVPSLALLVFMIPLLGIGSPPAIAALFLYSLLPIVRNTATGLSSVPHSLIESADALGLSARARLLQIEVPLASRTMLAGIKTAVVINVGTATLGALIGAGGYGQSIITGIRLDDVSLILQGAIPAALMALAAQGAFDLLDRVVVPRGLRL